MLPPVALVQANRLNSRRQRVYVSRDCKGDEDTKVTCFGIQYSGGFPPCKWPSALQAGYDRGGAVAHMRSGPVLRDGTNTSRYDMNMTGYRELSVTPLSLRKHATEGTC